MTVRKFVQLVTHPKLLRDYLVRRRNRRAATQHSYVNLQSYVEECPEKAQILACRTESLVYAKSLLSFDNETHTGNAIGLPENFTLATDGENEIRTTHIHNATCFAYSDVILLDDGRCLYDLKERNELLPYCRFAHDILVEDYDSWCKLKPWITTNQISRGIKIGGMYGFNFYHLIFQLLPRMFETENIDPSVPLLFDQRVQDIPNFKQLVDWCNFDGRDILFLKQGIAYMVQDLFLVTSANICIPNTKPGFSLYEPKARFSETSIRQLAQTFLPHISNKKTPEKVFICRRGATNLRSYNEEEIVLTLKPYGFEEVNPECLTPAEQIAVFRNAKIIVSPEGAALSNLLFIRPGCKVIILYCMPGITSEFGTLVLLNGGELTEIYDIPDGDLNHASYQRNYYIAPKTIQKVIPHLI